MRKSLTKTLVRHKLIKASKEVKAFLEQYPLEMATKLEATLDEFLVLCSEDMEKKSLERLFLSKIEEMRLDVNPANLESIYLNLANKAFSMLKPKLDKSASFSFDGVDTDAIASMRKGFYWMGKEYNQRLQNELKDIIEDVFRGESSHLEMGGILREKFGEIISADERYFKGVADHILLQSQNVARITQGSKYGVEHYKVLAIMDNRTTPICRSMHGRIIPAKHLEAQADNILNAKSMSEKKNAAVWRSDPFFGKSGKMDSNFGAPPYHFRCRTELVAVWVEEEVVDGVSMKNTRPLGEDEVVRHIDKSGVERVLMGHNYRDGKHSMQLQKRVSSQDIVKALNSINTTAPNSANNYLNAFSDNGYFMVFNGDEIVTAFKPSENKKKSFEYFKNASSYDKKEVIKWRTGNFLLSIAAMD